MKELSQIVAVVGLAAIVIVVALAVVSWMWDAIGSWRRPLPPPTVPPPKCFLCDTAIGVGRHFYGESVCYKCNDTLNTLSGTGGRCLYNAAREKAVCRRDERKREEIQKAVQYAEKNWKDL